MEQHTVQQAGHCTRGCRNPDCPHLPGMCPVCDCALSKGRSTIFQLAQKHVWPSSGPDLGASYLTSLYMFLLLPLQGYIELLHAKGLELCLAHGKHIWGLAAVEWAESPYLKAYLGWVCQSLVFGRSRGYWLLAVWSLSLLFFLKDSFQPLKFLKVQLLILKAADCGISGAFFIWNRVGWLRLRAPQIGW